MTGSQALEPSMCMTWSVHLCAWNEGNYRHRVYIYAVLPLASMPNCLCLRRIMTSQWWALGRSALKFPPILLFFFFFSFLPSFLLPSSSITIIHLFHPLSHRISRTTYHRIAYSLSHAFHELISDHAKHGHLPARPSVFIPRKAGPNQEAPNFWCRILQGPYEKAFEKEEYPVQGSVHYWMVLRNLLFRAYSNTRSPSPNREPLRHQNRLTEVFVEGGW